LVENRNAESNGKEGDKMEWQVIVAMVLAVPIILLPVAFVWYLNIGGVVAAVRQARKRKAVPRVTAKEVVR
jgi:hypothetical protein